MVYDASHHSIGYLLLILFHSFLQVLKVGINWIAALCIVYFMNSNYGFLKINWDSCMNRLNYPLVCIEPVSLKTLQIKAGDENYFSVTDLPVSAHDCFEGISILFIFYKFL